MAALSFASPTRVLDRMKEMEAAELPSLPSIQPVDDYDSGVETSEYTEDEATPLPLRQHTAQQAHLPSADNSGSGSDSSAPFPPLPSHSPSMSDSPYVPSRTGTSTPFGRSTNSRRTINNDTPATARFLGQSRGSSDTGRYGSDKWHTPGEMSGSFSGEEIVGDGLDLPSLASGGGLGSEKSIPLRDESMDSLPAETPLTKRFSTSHVVLQRPGRRSQIQPPSPQTTPYPQPRLPSLTKSEASATDTSGVATTPEGPVRQTSIQTPGFSRSLNDHSLEISEREHLSIHEATVDMPTIYSTPGMAREPIHIPEEPASTFKPSGSPALSDVTDRFHRSLNTPFTPSPANASQHTKFSDYSTPRAPLNDVERRKSHVVAVLSSAKPRQRTPHPLRRVSISPTDPSISEEGTPTTARLLERSASAPPNDSFVSIASSADLTTDRRAVANTRTRGNTSFPTMLLPQANQSANSSIRITHDRRADGIKIQKHLNAMNKQLLETNADLAREAEGWKEETLRLRGLLQSAGVEFDDVDLATANASIRSRPDNQSIPAEDSAAQLLAGMPRERAEEIMQEMAEKLEEYEEMMNDKDAQIVELQEEVETMRQSVSCGADVLGSSHEDTTQSNEAVKAKINELEREKAGLQAGFAAQTEENAKQFADICATLESRVKALEEQLEQRDQERKEAGQVEEMQRQLEDIEAQRQELANQLENAAFKLAEVKDQFTQAEEQIARISADHDALASDKTSLNDMLHHARTEADQLRDEVDELNRILEERDAKIEALQGKVELAEPLRASVRDRTGTDQSTFIAAIEEKLDEAYREIGRLKHELLSTPHRKSTLEAKDARIKALEREKASLLERQDKSISLPSGLGSAGSPFGKPTPLFNRALKHLKPPKTPGSMMEMSWLNTTVGDANESILRQQVNYLQAELAQVNGQLDSNFSRLEEAGLSSVALAEKLAIAQARIGELEDELRALLQKDKRSVLDMRSQEDIEERLQSALQAVHQELDLARSDFAKERSRLQQAIERLQQNVVDANANTDKETDRMRQETVDALDAAHGDVEQAKKDAIAATQETADLRRDLATAQGAIKRLEKDLVRATEEYDELHRRHIRQAADSVSSAVLQQKETTIRELEVEIRKVREEASFTASELGKKADLLTKTYDQLEELRGQQARVMRQLSTFDDDLVAQMDEASRLKQQLKALKANERSIDNVQAELRRVEKERAVAEAEVREAEKAMKRFKVDLEGIREWKASHACGGNTQQALDDQRARFKAQTRDLAAQIRYLKAKFTRESTFRNGLSLQKRYLLLLVGGMSLNEQATIKAIAQMGFPAPEPSRPKRTMRAAAIAVLALIRARNSATAWREEKNIKEGAMANFNSRRA